MTYWGISMADGVYVTQKEVKKKCIRSARISTGWLVMTWTPLQIHRINTTTGMWTLKLHLCKSRRDGFIFWGINLWQGLFLSVRNCTYCHCIYDLSVIYSRLSPRDMVWRNWNNALLGYLMFSCFDIYSAVLPLWKAGVQIMRGNAWN